ncbi:Inner membrane protein yccS [Kingella potus]|uniref:Inner membrane protein yccS n=1 Tax=Kingella potus TaxID=265175 RepID=A0A377R0E0_9NEIS|nr:YccS family putative transporter [Kingella potus]STR00450.1 Inner membrane protein yccS [Kingella potus]
MKFKTPPVSGKVVAVLPPLIAVSAVALLVYRFSLQSVAIPLVLGVIAGGLVDLDNALAGRLKNSAVSLAAFAVSSLSAQAALGHRAFFLPVMAALAFVFTMAGAVGLRYRTIAFGTLAVAVYTTLTYDPASAAVWYLNPLMILCGAGLYSLCALFLHILLPHRTVQENTADAYDALGAYLDAKAGFFDPDETGGLEERQIALAMANSRVIQAFNLCRSALFYRMRGQHRHPRTTRMLRYYFAAQDIHERASSSHISYRDTAEKLKNTDLIFRFLRLMELQAQACRDIAAGLRENRVYEPDARLTRARQGLKQSAAHYAAAHADSPETPLLQRLSGNLQNINHRLSTLDSGLDENPAADQRIAHHDSAKLRDAAKNIFSQLTPRSATFRHAVRMSLLVIVCGLIVETLHLNFGYWILLTAVFVCQPNHSATQSRLKQRITGTLGGVIVGSLLPYFTQSLEAKLMVMAAGVALFFLFRANKYSYSTFFITIQALISFSIAGYDITQALPMRMADTVIGCLLAWAAVSYIWPDWHYLRLDKTGAAAIAADAGYLNAVIGGLERGGGDDVAYRAARRLAHERAAALSSTLSDMSGEPAKYGSRLHDGFRLLKINYSLIGYISALGAYRDTLSRDAEHQAFLHQWFPAAAAVCALARELPDLSDAAFAARLADSRAALAALAPDSEQAHILTQQITAAADLLEPAFQALHGRPESALPPPRAMAEAV